MTNPEQSAESVRAEPTVDDFLWAIAYVRAHYPEDVFPPLGTSLDCASARFARGLCDEVRRIALERCDERDGPDDAHIDGTEGSFGGAEWAADPDHIDGSTDG